MFFLYKWKLFGGGGNLFKGVRTYTVARLQLLKMHGFCMDVVVNIYQGWIMSVNTNTNFHPSKSSDVILTRVLARILWLESWLEK